MSAESAGRGRFVAFEGGEASGKSTQAVLLAAELDAVLTREPGGTRLGATIRGLVLDPAHESLSDRAEALLFAADRAQHVHEVIAPALDAGRHVVSDRFAGSSFAYQAFGRRLPLAEVTALSEFAVDGWWPDLTILLVVPPELADARLADRDRMEGVGAEFHRRVADGFEALAAADPDRWARIEATGSVEQVAAEVRAVVQRRLGLGR